MKQSSTNNYVIFRTKMAKLSAVRGLRATNLPCSLLTKQFRATVGQMAARAVMQQYEIVPEQTRSLVASARACSWRSLKSDGTEMYIGNPISWHTKPSHYCKTEFVCVHNVTVILHTSLCLTYRTDYYVTRTQKAELNRKLKFVTDISDVTSHSKESLPLL
jgi:hypothetical protein